MTMTTDRIDDVVDDDTGQSDCPVAGGDDPLFSYIIFAIHTPGVKGHDGRRLVAPPPLLMILALCCAAALPLCAARIRFPAISLAH